MRSAGVGAAAAAARRAGPSAARELTLVPVTGWSQTSSIFLMSLLSDLSTDCFFFASSAACGGAPCVGARRAGAAGKWRRLVGKHGEGNIAQQTCDQHKSCKA